MRKLLGIVLCFLMLFMFSCKSSRQPGKNNGPEVKTEAVLGPPTVKKLDFSNGPPTIVYRTREDYRLNVAVTLNDDKTEVVGYPGQNDVYYKDLIAYPYPLKNGYLLDNRGINKNTAFMLECHKGTLVGKKKTEVLSFFFFLNSGFNTI